MGYRAVARQVYSLEPKAVVLHGSRLLPIAMWLRVMPGRVPLIGVLHAHREITSPVWRCICTAFSAAVDCTVTVSGAIAELIGSFKLLRRTARGLCVIFNGLPPDGWHTELPSRTPTRPLRIGMVATMEPSKDHPTLFAAVRRLCDAGRPIRMELIGDGPREKALRRLCSQLCLGSVVRFCGMLPYNLLRERIGTWDIFVHVTHSEGMSMALLEGMMSARPIVASDVTGVAELIEHERTGLLVADGDAGALTTAIGRLADEPELSAALATAARDSAVANYSAKRMAQAYEKVIGELLAG